jgi:hypothetical protein
MTARCRSFVILAATICLVSIGVLSQDEPSLGDLARQQRQQKAQSKAAPDKNVKPSKVVTNEEIPEQAVRTMPRAGKQAEPPDSENPDSTPQDKTQGEYWRSQILTQKNQVASLQKEIDDLNESIRFAPPNCVANCVEWNQRQREKQERVERMQAQLEEQKQSLEDMQESARKQGYGSSVYDP